MSILAIFCSKGLKPPPSFCLKKKTPENWIPAKVSLLRRSLPDVWKRSRLQRQPTAVRVGIVGEDGLSHYTESEDRGSSLPYIGI